MFAYLDKVLSEKGHAVVCVAEGAGQVRQAGGGLRWQCPAGSLAGGDMDALAAAVH